MSSFEQLKAQRGAVVAAANEAREAQLAESRRIIHACGVEHAKAVAAADKAFTAEVAKRKASITGELYRELLPRMADFIVDDNRKASSAVLECWRSFDARAQEETGEALGHHHLLLALASAKFPDAGDRLGDPVLLEGHWGSGIANAVDGAQCRAELLHSESILSTRYPRCTPIPGRLEMLRGALSGADLTLGNEAFDAARQAERLAAHVERSKGVGTPEFPVFDRGQNRNQPVVRDFLSRVADGARQGFFGQ